MPEIHVTVFGGTGFLGRRIVERLRAQGATVYVAARRADRAEAAPRLRPVAADIHDAASVRAAVRGADAVVNAVGLYVEGAGATFRSVHVDGARRVAEAAAECGAGRMVHVSGIGADAGSASPYVSARGAGEDAVQATFPGATILRPGPMFAEGEGLGAILAGLVRRLPVVPLFGTGGTRLQPVHVDDVARAVAVTVIEAHPGIHELGGPDVYTYRELLELVMRREGRRRLLLPVPFPVWDALAACARALPSPPLTEGQVALMRQDTVADPERPGLAALGVAPTPIEAALRGPPPG